MMVAVKVISGSRPELPSDLMSSGLNKPIWDLMEACWDPDPDIRPSATAVLSYIEETARAAVRRESFVSPAEESVGGHLRTAASTESLEAQASVSDDGSVSTSEEPGISQVCL
jgi:hypothetical protein